MNWRYITTGAIVAASAATLINAKVAGGLSDLIFPSPLGLWQETDLSVYPDVVHQMDDCLRGYLEWGALRESEQSQEQSEYHCQVSGTNLSTLEQSSIRQWRVEKFSIRSWSIRATSDQFNDYYTYTPRQEATHSITLVVSQCPRTSVAYFDIATTWISGTNRTICF